MNHIALIQSVNHVDNSLYDLDGASLYNKATGNTEKDITELSFKEVLEKVLEEEEK